MKHRWGFRTIRMNLLVSFAVLMAAVLAITVFVFARINEANVLDHSVAYTTQMIDQLNADIDEYISYMDNISMLVAGSPDVRNYLGNADISSEEEAELRGEIGYTLEMILDMHTDIRNIVVYGNSDRYVLGREAQELNPYMDVEVSEWYRDAMNKEGYKILSSSHVQNVIKGEYNWVVTLSRAIQNAYRSETYGVLMVDLSYRVITEKLAELNLGDMGYMFLMDADGNIIYHPKQQLLNTGLYQELVSEVLECDYDYFTTGRGADEKVYVKATSESTGWTVVGVANLTELAPNPEQIRDAYAISALLMMTAVLVVTYLFSRRISKPLVSLESAMAKVQEGNFGVHLPEEGMEEISTLSKSFNRMSTEIVTLMDCRSSH